MTTNNIGSGQTYTTIQAWEDATVVTSSPWIGVIQDNANFDETVTFAGGTGTPDITNHVRLEVASGVRHLGVAGAGARIDNTSADTQAILISSNFVHIKDLEVTRSGGSPGASDEGLRLSDGVTDVLLEKLLVHTALTAADTDGIYMGNDTDADVTILDCIIYGWTRAGIHYQNTTAAQDQTVGIRVDFASVYDCGAAGETESGGICSRANGDATVVTINIRNSAMMDTASTFDDWSAFDSKGDERSNWVCATNITSDASQSGRDLQVADVVTGALESKLIANVWTDAANGDFTVVASGDADAAGADISGAKADSRGDYTTDIAGTSRHATTPSIGAFEIAAAGGGLSIPVAMGSYRQRHQSVA